MHGLVTGKDPRQRGGDLELKLENPLGFLKASACGDQRGITSRPWLSVGSASAASCLLGSATLLEELQPHRSRLSAYALERSWVDKDPRLCITYSAYLHILLRRVPLIVALREPLAVAASLHARNGFSLNRGLVLWWVYNHHVSSQMCSEDLLLLYSDLLDLMKVLAEMSRSVSRAS